VFEERTLLVHWSCGDGESSQWAKVLCRAVDGAINRSPALGRVYGDPYGSNSELCGQFACTPLGSLTVACEQCDVCAVGGQRPGRAVSHAGGPANEHVVAAFDSEFHSATSGHVFDLVLNNMTNYVILTRCGGDRRRG
jgi:hypothetical protein